MQETGREDRQQSGTELVGSISYSGPLGGGPPNKRAGRRSAGFSIPENREGHEEPYMEVTLDVRDDSVAVQSVKPANGDKEDADSTLLAKGLKRKSAANVVRNASARIKQVSEEFKRYASFSKRPPPVRLERTKSSAAYALKGLKFISKTDGASGWPAVEKRFDEITVSSNGLLPRSQFCECIGMKESKEFAGELFNALARKRNITGDSICKEELRQFWEQISDQSFDSRLQTFFDMVDKDADGKLTEVEVREIITLSASANKLSSIQKKAEEYARLIMEELDPEKHGYIMIENLETLLLEGAKQSAIAGESKKLSKMLSQKLKPTLDDNPVRRWCRFTKYFILDNWQRFWVMALWIGVMAGLFAYKYVQYRHRAAYEVMGNCVCIAKGAAETLKLNMALILLPVCRNTLTWLRNKTKLSVVVPFDDHLNFHKVIAVGITIGVGIHGIFHLACDFPRLIHASAKKWKLMEPFFGNHPTNYSYFLKSVEGVTGIIMVILMGISITLATSWFRRGQIKNNFLKKLTGFNAFWYSHHLFIIVYTLLIVHGHYLYLAHEWYKKTTWMYIAVSITLYAGERLIRALRSSTEAVTIKKAAIYSGNVLALHMSKPQGFRYKSGQYMFVNCAAVSPFEWHPFSITSAPGDDYLSVHIRAVGDWTNELRNVFTKVCQTPTTGKSGLLRADCFQGNDNPNFPRVLIDGPYGAPAQDFWKYEVVLLVGLGIGATPMISIVKDVARNLRAMEEEANAIENGTLDTRSNSSPVRNLSPNSQKRREHFKIRRAYFYWVTKEQGSFDWFKGAMDEVVELDHNHVIELHNYCTSVYEEDDVRSALITMLQQLNHAKNGVDIVSGTRVKSHFAKPDWNNVYKNIALNHPDSRVGVFYCGLPKVAKELRHLALDFSHKTNTKFHFHKENF